MPEQERINEDGEVIEEGTALDDILESVEKRIKRLGEIKTFDGELSKREFRDEVYPTIQELLDFVMELDTRVSGIEADEAVAGIPRELAAAILQAIARGAAMADLASALVKDLAVGQEAVVAAAIEAQQWFAANAQTLTEDVQSLILLPEDEDDND